MERDESLSPLWLGLRITKRIQLFDPDANIMPPELLGSSPDQLFRRLADLVIESVIRPRVTTDDERLGAVPPVRQADLYALLHSTAACNSPEEVAQALHKCPTTKSLVLMATNPSPEDRCLRCGQHLVVDPQAAAPGVEDAELIHHLVKPSAEDAQSLFEDHQKFLFFFERVTELFIHQRRNNPQDVGELLRHLLSDRNRLRVTWRFLTVIVRSVLSTDPSGNATIDPILATLRCNTPNARNFLRALVVCADDDAAAEIHEEMPPEVDWAQASMAGIWTVGRIRRLASIRRQLSDTGAAAALDALEEWSRWRRNEHDDPAALEAFLFFVLRFGSAEGDVTRLGQLFREARVAEELQRHPIVGGFIKVMAPLSLGFDLLPRGGHATEFDERLARGLDWDDQEYQNYRILQVSPIVRLKFI